MNTKRSPLLPHERLGAVLLPLGATLLLGCVHSGGGPSFGLSESEPNDAACCADYFGFLTPGEHLSINGFISDDGFDPFDGFAFTASGPITVDFRLFAHDFGADLDICLYDPQLGIIIDCFESPFDPETGTAHILLGGTDFHLVVNSFSGDTPYTLEIDVHPLFFASDTPAPAGATIVPVPGDPRGKADRMKAFEGYLGRADLDTQDPVNLDVGQAIELDLSTGETRTAPYVHTSRGTFIWMGSLEEVDA